MPKRVDKIWVKKVKELYDSGVSPVDISEEIHKAGYRGSGRRMGHGFIYKVLGLEVRGPKRRRKSGTRRAPGSSATPSRNKQIDALMTIFTNPHFSHQEKVLLAEFVVRP